jgi:hypothetical protein
VDERRRRLSKGSDHSGQAGRRKKSRIEYVSVSAPGF